MFAITISCSVGWFCSTQICLVPLEVPTALWLRARVLRITIESAPAGGRPQSTQIPCQNNASPRSGLIQLFQPARRFPAGLHFGKHLLPDSKVMLIKSVQRSFISSKCVLSIQFRSSHCNILLGRPISSIALSHNSLYFRMSSLCALCHATPPLTESICLIFICCVSYFILIMISRWSLGLSGLLSAKHIVRFSN